MKKNVRLYFLFGIMLLALNAVFGMVANDGYSNIAVKEGNVNGTPPWQHHPGLRQRPHAQHCLHRHRPYSGCKKLVNFHFTVGFLAKTMYENTGWYTLQIHCGH